MKCQILFSGKNKKNVTTLWSAELAKRVLRWNRSLSSESNCLPFPKWHQILFFKIATLWKGIHTLRIQFYFGKYGFPLKRWTNSFQLGVFFKLFLVIMSELNMLRETWYYIVLGDFPPYFIRVTTIVTSFLHSRAHLFRTNYVVS